MKRFDNPILVTRPYLPPLAEFQAGCEEIWRNQWLTNNGPMLQRFASELAAYLGVPETNLALFNNGTLALELGYYAMDLAGGDVITTPFTFVATSHALKRIGATPIFADIDPETLCLDPAKVEKLITPRTKAIVPVHVYGHVCDVEAFDRLSEKYGIPVIYDAAHAFGVTGKKVGGESRWTMDGLSIASCGAMSMFSFHPTKLFHSCEGGCLVFKDRSVVVGSGSCRKDETVHPTTTTSNYNSNNLQSRLFELRNFAIHSETSCTDVGSNAKMNELQALMGLCCLRKMPELLAKRKAIYDAYASVFDEEKKIGVENRCTADGFDSSDGAAGCRTYAGEASCLPSKGKQAVHLLPYSANHAYVPVLFKTADLRDKVYTELKEKCNVFSRRYFYPLLTDFAPYIYAKGTCPIAEDIASRVLTLPTYYDLALEDVREIAKNVREIVEG